MKEIEMTECDYSLSDNRGLPDLQLMAIEKFGLTYDPQKVHFVLSDGSSIPITIGKFNEHVNVSTILPKEEPFDVLASFLESGAIRFRRTIYKPGDDSTIIQFPGFQNRDQMTTIKHLIKDTQRMHLEFTKFPGNTRVLYEHVQICPSALSIRRFLDSVREKMLHNALDFVAQPEYG